jgi:hypothetical protein
VRLAIATLVLAVATPAAADPYRLRGDALASVASPTGLVALDADGDVGRGMRAEALLWFGNDGADALVADIEATRGPVVARLGRFVVALGALRPVHVDGGSARVNLPRRFVAEAFAGVPVEPRLGARAFDWVVGARASRLLGDWGSVGLGWLERREEGRLSSHELGLDGGLALGAHADAGGLVALDLIHGGIAEAQLTAATRRGRWRYEAYAGERSPSRLLPATSLFSVIGDVASRRAGADVRWRAAPRLDLRADVGALAVGDDIGADLALRADLRLDDRGAGAVSVELRREGAPEGGWTGARATLRRPLTPEFTASAELEVAVPDAPTEGTGTIWPWALAALGWHRGPWEVAAAIEASASPRDRYRIDALARVGRRWELP